MRTVKYNELSRAMHDFTKQIDALDECIEVGLVSGEKVQISIRLAARKQPRRE